MFNNMKKGAWLLLLVVLGLVISACQPSPDTLSEEPRTITVEGTGHVSLDPTLARISIGVRTEGENAQEAVSENNQHIADVISRLQDAGISEQDIQTSNFSIRQEEQRKELEMGEGSTSKQYVVTNTVRVTLRDLDQMGSVLDDVIQAGANAIQNIQFDAENKAEANQKALELAIKDARARAETIAGATDVELGDVYSVEAFGGGPVFAERMEAEIEGAAVPVSPGQLDIQVRVTVRYQING